MEKKQNKQKIERRCPKNKVLVNNKCDTQTKCGKNYLYDEQKNECNKKRVLLKKLNTLLLMFTVINGICPSKILIN